MTLTVGEFEEWIARTESPHFRGLHFLGIADQRITFYSQQVRALHLIHALEKSGRMSRGDNVAVIGGGAAGVTAATAAALAGCHVALIEQTTGLFFLQGGSKRLLHPHIYEWPARGSLEVDAVLPVLGWHAGHGRDVIRTIQAYINGHPLQNLDILTGSAVTSVTA